MGNTVQLQGTFIDPDNTGGYTFAWRVVNNSGQQVAAGTTQTFSFVPAAPDLYFATFTVTDGVGGLGGRRRGSRQGRLPTAAISGAATAAEGSTYQLNLATAGIAPSAITGWTIKWGDGTTNQQVAGNPSQVLHTYSDGPVNRTIIASAMAGSTAIPATHNLTVAIGNAAPIATSSLPDRSWRVRPRP